MTAAPPAWATASDGDTAETTPMELAVLGEHMAQCSVADGRLAALRCGAGRLLAFAARRLVTTGAALLALGAALLMWL